MSSVARRHKAAALLRDGRVVLRTTGKERIHLDVKDYQVIFHRREHRWTCTCRYSTLKQEECYHILAARMLLLQTLQDENPSHEGKGL